MESVVIIGGGVAGLSCLNALLDYDVSPLLLEGSYIGKPKMCGEFLAPPAVTVLEHWDIGPIKEIHHAKFLAKNREINLNFSPSAGALNREQAELLLAARAKKRGGRIRENTLIVKIKPPGENGPYIFELASGEEIRATSAIFATGKYSQLLQAHPLLPYFGIKTHFNHVVKSDTLIMHSHAGAYFGIVPVSETMSNFACLVKKQEIEKAGSCRSFFEHIMATHASMQPFLSHAPIDWLESKAPHFQLKQTPAWKNSYWIGDALASLPPAVGSGFSHSISSAILGANFYLQNNFSEYLKKSKKQIRQKIVMANAVHQILLRPIIATSAVSLFQSNQWLMNWCMQKLVYD